MPLHECPEHGYTLGSTCPSCGKATRRPGPAKFSPEDQYGDYRRRLKRLDRAEKSREAPTGPAEGERE